MKRISASLILSSLALFFSVCGAGIAASHYLITSTSQIKPGVLRQLRGARGPAGTAGLQGSPGLGGVISSQSQEGHFCGSAGGCPAAITVVASCPPGQAVTGGAASVTIPDVVISTADIGTAYEASVDNTSSTDGNLEVTAICATLGP